MGFFRTPQFLADSGPDRRWTVVAVSHGERASSRRSLITAPYQADSTGRLLPRLPGSGPCAVPGEACRIGIHHWRARKTGPGFPLAVCECRQHAGSCFTLYPPGHVPYARRALVMHAPDGKVVRDKDDPRRGTLFEAALDAAAGKVWPVAFAHALGADGVRSTQRRRIQRLSVLTGVALEQVRRLREGLGQALGCGLTFLAEKARSGATRLRKRSAAVLAVLTRASRGGRGATFGRLCASGYLAGLWGLPFVLGSRGPLRLRTSLRRGPLLDPG